MNVRNTLKKNSEFRRLYTRGKSAGNSYMAVYCRRSGRPLNRFGFTVSTKLGNAVVRNRIRRRLREIVRLNGPRLRTGWDVVIVARRRCADGDYHRMDAAFLRACGELGLLKEGEA